jgi:hypothetical protein
MIHDDSIKEVAEGNSPYPAFLNSEEKMLQVARTVRAQAESKS